MHLPLGGGEKGEVGVGVFGWRHRIRGSWGGPSGEPAGFFYLLADCLAISLELLIGWMER